MSQAIAMDAMRDLTFPDPLPAGSTLADLRFTRATFDQLRPRHALFDATNPDLSAFARRGGKLLIYYGLADPHISPLNSVAFHEAVRATLGSAVAEGFERLYLLPGMSHCSRGEGPSEVDFLTPVMRWVETRRAPDAVETRTPPGGRGDEFGQPDGARRGDAVPPGLAPPVLDVVQRSRPVFPYPFTAAWNGTGDAKDAASFGRGRAASLPVPRWAGSDFFRPFEAAP